MGVSGIYKLSGLIRLPHILGRLGKTPTFPISADFCGFAPQHLPQYLYNQIRVDDPDIGLLENREKSMALGFSAENVGEYWGKLPT